MVRRRDLVAHRRDIAVHRQDTTVRKVDSITRRVDLVVLQQARFQHPITRLQEPRMPVGPVQQHR